MNKFTTFLAASLLTGGSAFASTIIRVDFSATASTGFAPLGGIFHDGSVGTFNSGNAANFDGLEGLAEGGNPDTFLAGVQAGGGEIVTGRTDGQTGGMGRPSTRSFEVTIPEGSSINSFNFAAMFLPSNDWFITGSGSLDITSLLGGGVGGTEVISLTSIYDAGTELEDFTRGGGTGEFPFGLAPRLANGLGGDDVNQTDDITLVTQAAGENLFAGFANPNAFDISAFNDVILGQEFGTITLTVVPEPSSTMLAFLGLIPLLRRKRA